jgi:hypothetical protein
MPAGGGDFHRAFDMLLTFDLAKIEVLIHQISPPTNPWFNAPVPGRFLLAEIGRLQRANLPRIHPPSTTAASAALSSGTISVWRCRRLASKAIERTPLMGRNWPDKRQFTAHVKPVEVRQPIVFFQFQHRHGDRQIKSWALPCGRRPVPD